MLTRTRMFWIETDTRNSPSTHPSDEGTNVRCGTRTELSEQALSTLTFPWHLKEMHTKYYRDTLNGTEHRDLEII